MAATASLLPTFPRIFFLYVEPVLIAYGIYLTSIQAKILQSAYPALALPTILLGSSTMQHLVTMMLYSIGIMLSSPPNKRLAQLNIAVLAIADLTHWAGLFSVMVQTDPRGFGAVLDTKGWSDDVWQLALYPIGTLAVKIATLLGLFGKIKG